MKVIAVIALGLAAVLQSLSVSASVLPSTSPKGSAASPSTNSNFLPYPLANATFKGNAFGEKFEIESSSISSALAQLHAKYPGKDIDNELVDAAFAHDAELRKAAGGANGTTASNEEAVGVSKRHFIWPPLCIPVPGQPWEGVSSSDIGWALQTLRKIPVVKMPARRCVEGLCANEAFIYLCNDSNNYRETSTYWLAMRIQDMRHYCFNNHPSNWRYLGGQMFDDEGWNLIVAKGRGCQTQLSWW